MLEARGIRYIRDSQLILDGIRLTVAAGESLAITGPSGSGKTSLLAIISGLAAPASAAVSAPRRSVEGQRRVRPRSIAGRWRRLTSGWRWLA